MPPSVSQANHENSRNMSVESKGLWLFSVGTAFRGYPPREVLGVIVG